jgi:hypothetical protein
VSEEIAPKYRDEIKDCFKTMSGRVYGFPELIIRSPQRALMCNQHYLEILGLQAGV